MDIQRKKTQEETVPLHEVGRSLLAWTVPEYEEYHRGMWWYIISATVTGLLLLYAVLTSNFLFAVMIIIVAVIIILQISRPPERMDVQLTDRGVVLHHNFYPYSEIKSFWIAYKPPYVKSLYLHFNHMLRPEISIPLKNMNPLRVRKILLENVSEDPERDNETGSDILRRLLKI